MKDEPEFELNIESNEILDENLYFDSTAYYDIYNSYKSTLATQKFDDLNLERSVDKKIYNELFGKNKIIRSIDDPWEVSFKENKNE